MSESDGEPDTVFAGDNPETAVWEERLGQDVDHLTGLKQRASLDRMLKNIKTGTFGLLFIDMDNLKTANDVAKSHTMGDRALKTIANELNLNLRDRDVQGHDEAFRISGDEFVVVLDKVTKTEDLKSIAERVKGTIGSHVFTYDKGKGERGTFPLTVSIGASLSRTDDKSGNEALRRADYALYKAKEERNRYVIYEEMDAN
jgi:diguanylate cyclase (GGDEF)-like protein